MLPFFRTKLINFIMKNNGEISLDPNNWDEIRKLGYQSIDLMIEYLSNIEQNKVWKPIPPKAKEYFSSSIPLKPQSTNEIFTKICKQM